MKVRSHALRIAVPALCALLFVGCGQQDGITDPTTPSAAGSGNDPALFGATRTVGPVVAPDGPVVVVTKSLGPAGGTIEAGRISVEFPAGSLPGQTDVSLAVWSVGEAYYFTLEPRSVKLQKAALFTYKVEGGKPDGLTFNWNNGGWREPMPSHLNGDQTLLQTGATFLGEFVVAPEWKGKGRAGW